MTTSPHFQFNPQCDLVLERILDISSEDIWNAWTVPKQLMKWFTPVPWKTVDCEIDLRAGGIFRTVMQGPEGQEFSGSGCYLEVKKNERLVWTSALLPGFRPNVLSPADSGFFFTCVISLEPQGKKTKYSATVIHKDAKDCDVHSKMGFHDGWGKALDQLVKMVQGEKK